MVAVTASRLLSSTLSVASLVFLYSVTNSRVLALQFSLAERVYLTSRCMPTANAEDPRRSGGT